VALLRPRRLLLLALTAFALVLPASASAQEPTWTSPPAVNVPGGVGAPVPGDVLTGDVGGLVCSPACSQISYTWFHCTANSNTSSCVPVDAGFDTYLVQPSDVGWSIVLQITATNRDCNEANTECRDVTRTRMSPPSLPVGGSLTVFPATLPSAMLGVLYNQLLLVSAPQASFALVSGTLPPGIALSSNGSLGGMPTAVGTYSFTVRASTAVSAGTRTYVLPVAEPPLTITPSRLFPATPGVFYSVPLQASGGTAPYKWSLSSGSLPDGLTLGSDGTLSGIAGGAPGVFTFSVSVKDKDGLPGFRTLTLVVNTPVILATPTALPAATVGSAYLQTIGAIGGVAPYTFSLLDGALPAGLSLAPSGRLAGTPTVRGTSLFTVRIADAKGISGEQTYRLVVEPSTTPVKTPPKKTAPKPKKKPKKR
jgi:hypothetical protein